MLQNNLINITNRDFIYTLVSQRIGGHLPKDLQSIYNTCEHIQIIATDCYFLHYSLYPFLRNQNDDAVLEEVRRFLQDYMSDERYQRVKMLTTLDDEMSLVYSIALAKAIIGKVLGKLVGELEFSQLLNPDKSVKSRIVSAVLALAESGELGLILDYATEEAEEVTKNANEIRELIGGKKAGKEAGTFKKVLDLAEHMLYVKFMKEIVTMSKKLSEYVPKASRILKKRGRFGDELSGYTLTKRIERALPREIALPDELFFRKLTGEGFLMKEKLSIAEGAYYLLIDKCLSSETSVMLRSGDVIRIDEICEGDRVISFDLYKFEFSSAKVCEVVCNGIQKVFRIVTDRGSFCATPNHVVPVFRNGFILELPVFRLKVGDTLLRIDGTARVIDIRLNGKSEVYDLRLNRHHHFIADEFIVHNSGSMYGEKTIWARSVAMALYRMSKTKKRKYFLRFFDTRVYPPDSPIKEPEEIVDAILKVKSNGGTDITNAISTALKDLIERGLSDYTNTIIIITDGEDVVQDLSKELKKANASLISVMIQGDNETLKALSDQYMKAELSEVGGVKLLKIVEVS